MGGDPNEFSGRAENEQRAARVSFCSQADQRIHHNRVLLLPPPHNNNPINFLSFAKEQRTDLHNTISFECCRRRRRKRKPSANLERRKTNARQVANQQANRTREREMEDFSQIQTDRPTLRWLRCGVIVLRTNRHDRLSFFARLRHEIRQWS